MTQQSSTASITKSGLGQWLLLSLLLMMAFWLRIQNLGELGLYGDADHTYFAVKGILDKGYPIMPSGMFYPRGLIYSYLAALASSIFGLTEFSLRLPSVVFSILALGVLYVLLKNIFDTRVAIVTTALLSLSVWDIQIARHARMYETLLFFYLSSTLCFYKGIMQGNRKYKFLVPLMFILTTSVHELGVFLNLLFLCPFLLKNYHVISRKILILYAMGIGLTEYLLMKIISIPYTHALAGIRIENVSQVKSKKDLLVPSFTFLQQLVSGWNWISIVTCMLLAGIWILCFLKVRDLHSKNEITLSDWLLFALMSIAAILHQFGVALWVLVFALFLRHKGLRGLLDTRIKVHVVFLLSTGVVWFVWGMLHTTESSTLLGVKSVLKNLLDYPFVHLRVFFELMPWMTLIAVIASVMLFDACSRDSDEKKLIVLMGFLAPIVVIGFFYKGAYLRYFYMVYPFFVATYVWGIVQVVSTVVRHSMSDAERRVSIRENLVFVVSVVLVFSLSHYHSFSEARAVSERSYATKIKNPFFGYKTHPDHKGAGLFVKNNLSTSDVVIAMDFISAVYSGRLDYLLRTSGILEQVEVTREIYLDAPVIRSRKMLEEVLERNRHRNVWLITSPELVGPHRKKPGLSEDVMSFLETKQNKIVYTGRDRIAIVYAWIAQPLPPFSNSDMSATDLD